ncbi:MAG: 3-oxoacyl-ACP synthase [Desulfuromonas sp.]|nr:MAG: 3-oxoacyl-ACP synthase [Desulfuromonas sp.]
MTVKVFVAGTGSYVPEKVLTNFDLEKFLDTNDEWIVTRTGISERHIAADDENTSDLAVNAARNALEAAGWNAEDLELIVVGTITGDYPWPATSCIVQHKLGASNAAAYDVSAACSGFIYALSNAVAQIESGKVKKALVIGAEVLSRAVDWEDRNTCVLFGDGAGAVLLEGREGDRGVLSTHLHSDGSYVNLLYQPGFGSVHPPSQDVIDHRLGFLKMEGNEVFKVAVRMLTDVAKEAMSANGVEREQIDLFIPHQANRRILEATAKRLKFKDEQVYINVNRFGNTSAASIPIALDEANRNGKIKENDLILLDAFGGGFTWASALIRW